MQPEIISIGEPVIEFNIVEEDILSCNGKVYMGGGGDTSNFVIAASRLGGNVGYLTRLGKDNFGNLFIKLWKSEGIDTSHVEIDDNALTSISFNGPKTQANLYLNYCGNSAASKMTPDFIPDSYIQNAKLLHVSGTTQVISSTACDSVFAAIKAARETEPIVSYNPNSILKFWPLERARAIIHETISLADIIFLNLADAAMLTGFTHPRQIANFYLDFKTPQIVVLKLNGNKYLLAAKEMIDGFNFPIIKEYSSFEVNSIDISGSNDTFDAAFTVAYISGKKLTECCNFAIAAAALAKTGYGCIDSIPNAVEVEDFLQTVNN